MTILNYLKRFFIENKYTIALFLVILSLRFFIFPMYSVEGPSMDYTLAHGEKVIGINYFNIDRFDVVIIDIPEQKKLYVKRIIGLPGDKVEYKNDRLYINDKFIDEPFLKQKKKEWKQFTKDFIVEKIPEDEYFVLGDNRMHSVDSRMIGSIHKDKILSKLYFVYWPLNRLKVIE